MDAIVGKPTWTDARTQRIAELWSTSLTAQEIAANLGGFDVYPDGGRCAVLGKAHRMKLPPRGPRVEDPVVLAQRAVTRREKHRKWQREKRQSIVRDVPMPDIVLPFLGALGTPFADLRMFRSSEPNECRYIESADRGPEYLTCANPTKPGASYCQHHHRIVYAPRSLSAKITKAEDIRCL